jgi:IS6 family transposase
LFLKALQRPACSASSANGIEEQAAQSFRTNQLKATQPAPCVINVDKNAAYPKAIAELKAAGTLPEQVELGSPPLTGEKVRKA